MTTRPLNSVRVQGRLQREEGGHLHEQNSVVSEGNTIDIKPEGHTSVFLKEVVEGLDIHATDLVLDATAGQGGHSFAILSHNPGVTVLALDADAEAVAMTKKRLEKFKNRAVVVESNFEHVEKVLHAQGKKEIQKAIFDLGWNVGQLASGRGFSFKHDEPLSMSYGKEPASGFNAREIVNEWNEKTLADVFFGYSEEQYARRIAKAIIDRRSFQPIETTIELAELVRDSVPAGYRHGRIHPATKTFQALRIAVNDELGVIERGLEGTWKHLACGGRIAVISFHSTEDRVVKQLFQKFVKDSGRLVHKKPLVPTREEIIHNPRARSAKLRIVEKICEQ